MNTIVATQSTERPQHPRSVPVLVSTHHNGIFGVWEWTQLTPQERKDYFEAQRRNQYVQTFGIYD